MKDLLDKLSSYNLFNYLFPGIIFAVLAEEFTDYSIHNEDIILSFFIYYFIGLMVSRIGSLIVEPLLQRLRFLRYAEYKDFVIASKKDKNIELLSEVNNTYRTLSTLFLFLFFLKIYEKIEYWIPVVKTWNMIFLLAFSFILFLFSYRKQANYIYKRIKANL